MKTPQALLLRATLAAAAILAIAVGWRLATRDHSSATAEPQPITNADIERYLIQHDLLLHRGGQLPLDPGSSARSDDTIDRIQKFGLSALPEPKPDPLEWNDQSQSYLTPRQANYMAELRDIELIKEQIQQAKQKVAPYVAPTPPPATAEPR